MIKTILFLSLYTAAGIGSWSAYSYISSEDTSFSTLKNLVESRLNSDSQEQAIPTNATSIVYRWQNYQSGETNKDAPYSKLEFKSYQDELKFLHKLKESHKQRSASQIKQTHNAELSAIDQIKKLFADTKNVQNLVNTRTEETHGAINLSTQ